MYPVAARIILILSLLASLQASAAMLMPNDVHGAKVACADMNMKSMSDHAQIADKPFSKTSCGDAGCCMAFVATSAIAIMPVTKPRADFQNTPTQSPLHITHTNFRPPILS